MQAPLAPSWWPQGVAYNPNPPGQFPGLVSTRYAYQQSGRPDMQAAAQLSDDQFIQYLATNDTNPYGDAARAWLQDSASRNRPTVDLQKFWADAYNQQFNQRLAQSQLDANPRNLAQSLMMLGLPQGQGGAAPATGTTPVGATSSQVGSFLQASPYVQKAYSSTGLNPSTYNAGSNPDFGFTAGRHWNVREALNSNESDRNLREGLASFSGQNWNDYVSDFEKARPRGQTAGATKIL